MTLNIQGISKVTFESKSSTFTHNDTWVVNTRKEADYTTLLVTDVDGETIVPLSAIRYETTYVLMFSQPECGIAIFNY